ncbi:hypothetical protein [Allonocardiopsis opalescens]|uniref:Uncharacterized protein n=1 Tax=Allonocardiopsis opalescens TaxID=1144618 RepID=A0A2T0Q9X4_9ACTN|nr:hypothetical protein [Allonocardiopsis opalescens]PRY00637.1 hypothetical protein CLV72_102268 [Allonocardiopsis opalescens]
MFEGFVVLALVAILFAWGLTRLRRRIPLPFTLAGAVVVFILATLMLYAVQTT